MELTSEQEHIKSAFGHRGLTMPETALGMSEEDQITVIVCMDQLKTGVALASAALGYMPDSLERRYCPDEVNMIYISLHQGWQGCSQELAQYWSTDWVKCVEPERTELRLKLYCKIEEIRRAVRRSLKRELEAGKTTLQWVAAKQERNDMWYHEYYAAKEQQAREFDSKGVVSTPLLLTPKSKMKWMKAACKDMAGRLGMGTTIYAIRDSLIVLLGSNTKPQKEPFTEPQKGRNGYEDKFENYDYDCIECEDECSSVQH